MTFLPIVERELRVAARRRGLFGTRMKIAGAAILALAICYLANLVDPSIPFTTTLFWGLSGLCMFYCLVAGRLMTADCLSREKREGTLGLLFLTDLKGYDVVLGKLAATSLDGFYGLLAVFPMLAIPLLAGGMTSGEFWRMVLVLVNTFLFSLTIGVFVSSVCRDERKAMGANFALLLGLAGVPSAIGGLLNFYIKGFAAEQPLFYSCPVYSFWHCADKHFRSSPKDFWWSLGLTFILTCLLAMLACRIAPRSWQDKSVSSRSVRRKGERRRRWWREGRMEKALAFRKRLLDRNAYLWLAARPYLRATYVWIGVFLTAGCWAFTTWIIGSVEEETNVAFALLLNAMLKLWITTESGRQLAEDKKSGAFELLLSTPVSVGDILRGQRLALRRQFLMPVVLAVVVESVLTLATRHSNDREHATINRCVWLAGVLVLAADMVALGWVGMFSALTSKSHGRATVKTTAKILILPWLLYAAVEIASYVWMFLFCRKFDNHDWPFDLGCLFGVCMVVDFFFLLRARQRLRTNFRQIALEPFAPRRRFAWLRDWFNGSPERKTELRAKLRRAAKATAVLLVIVSGLVLYDIHASHAAFPKPVIVSINQSNNPVRIVAAQQGFFIILPDGSLWTWGRDGKVSPPRQFGTRRNWMQVSPCFNTSTLGLGADGTIWTWSSDNDPPKQIGSDNDWVEVCAGNDHNFARKRDGTLWGWGNNNQNQLGSFSGHRSHYTEPVRVALRDWTAIRCIENEALALRADGTLWTWGSISCVSNGSWSSTNYPFPVQFCRESNWVGMEDGFENGLRNQAGELWGLHNPLTAIPKAGVSIAALGHLLSSNGAMIAVGPLFTTNWDDGNYELRANGTLWAARGGPNGHPFFRFGQRSDWISIRGDNQTMIGLTADGTLWTWGVDYGLESHWTQVFVERIGVLKIAIPSLFGAGPPPGADYLMEAFPIQKEPRPLMKLVATHSAAGRSPP